MHRGTVVWLSVANVAVANAVALHFGPGGLRTSSTAVNLFATLLLCGLPLLVLCWRRTMRQFRTDSLLRDHATGATVLTVLACLGALLAAGLLPWVVLLVTSPLLVLGVPPAAARDLLPAVAPFLVPSLLVLLPLAHLVRAPTPAWSIVPGVLAFWQQLARRRGASSATLRYRDGALEVVIDPDTAGREMITLPLR